MPTRTPDQPAQEALHREIPDSALNESLTGAATVDEIDLGDVDNGGTAGEGTSILGKWVFVQCDVAFYWRRYSGETAPNSTSMQTGILWPADEVHEFFIDGNIAATNLAVEGAGAGTLKIELGSGA